MPRLIPSRPAAACALALSIALCAAAPALARGVRVHLRVVTGTGKVLADKPLRTGTASIRTSPRADCFGAGTGGSGSVTTIRGATALGALIQASRFTASLRPVSISDHFDFGLALCGVGGGSATDALSWYLKVNHKNPDLGGEDVRLHGGDQVLWALEPFPYPDELALKAPRHVKAGKAFKVRAFSYDDNGKRRPAAGVRVSDASGPTGADGRATVVLDRPAKLIARDGGDVPSNRAAVCVGRRCPRGAAR